MESIKPEPLTKAICNKGFTGNSSIQPRIKFRVCGQVSSPQFLTAYSLIRCMQSLVASQKDKRTTAKHSYPSWVTRTSTGVLCGK